MRYLVAQSCPNLKRMPLSQKISQKTVKVGDQQRPVNKMTRPNPYLKKVAWPSPITTSILGSILLLCWKRQGFFPHVPGTNIMICMASRHLPVQNGYYIDSTFGLDGNMCYVWWFLAGYCMYCSFFPVIKMWLE